MGKSKNKSRSETEHLKGQIRKLEAELKYYKKRSHFYEAPVEEIAEEIHNIDVNKCPVCKKGVVTTYDFRFAELLKCNECDYEQRKKKAEKKGY